MLLYKPIILQERDTYNISIDNLHKLYNLSNQYENNNDYIVMPKIIKEMLI